MLRAFQVKMRHLGEEDSGGTLYASDEYCAGLKKKENKLFFSLSIHMTYAAVQKVMAH